MAKQRSKARKWLRRIVLFFCVWLIVHETVIILDGVNDDDGSADIAVVLGTTVNPDGTLSRRLQSRLDKALDMYKEGRVKRFFVTGGLGIEGHYEGSKMQEYLINQGVAKRKIKVDNEGNNTRLSALHFRKTYSKNTTAMVVTQYYHVTRSKLAFRQVGVKKVIGVHSTYSETADAYSCLREFFGYYKYLLSY